MKPCFIRLGLLLGVMIQARSLSAATYNVGTLTDLNTRIASAVAGDFIIVSNGIYTNNSTINVSRVGTAANPITIAAQTLLGVELTGTKGFSLNSGAAYITIQGFKFTHSGSIGISSGSGHCRLTRNLIELAIPATNVTSYIGISGDDVQIDHNELRNKSTLGEMLDIAGSGSQVARRLWVHHNYFHDFSSPGGNGAETIRWGLSGLSLSTGAGLCEYNLFVRCEGENEMISNKSSGNTYRFNCMIDCIGGEISQRHGNDCYYYGNYLKNSQGMRVYGDRHRIFSNYFESNSVGVNMGNGDGDVYNGAALTAHDRPDDNVVAFNTFIGNDTHYEMGGRTGGLGSSNSVVANNIFMGGGSIASISTSAPYTGTWTNNIRWNTSSTGNMPASGYSTVNPLLVKDAKTVFHIQTGSPAINAGRGAYDVYGNYSSFPYVTNDMDGQPRDTSLDIGADEFSAAPATPLLLTTNDVGPYSGLTTNGTFLLMVTPASQIVMPGGVVNYSVSVTYSGGFTNTVALSVSGAPVNTSSNFAPVVITNTGSSTLAITTSNTTPQGSYTLTVRGTGGGQTNTATMTLTVSSSVVAAPGILLWSGGGATTTWSQQLNFTNLSASGSGTPGMSNDVFFANNAVVAGTNTVDSIVDSDVTIQSLTFTNYTGFHTVQINPGNTLTIIGTNGYQSNPSLNVGMDIHPASTVNVRAGITGIGGTLTVSNLNACVQVRQGFGSGNVGTLATLDMTGLGTFNASLRRFQLGSESGTPRRVAGVVYLARTNVITLNQVLDVNTTNWSSGTPALVLGHNTQAGNTNGSQLFLGIANTINVNNIVVGRGNQTNNLIAFNPAFRGLNPTVTLRGSDGVSRVGQWSIGDNSAGSIAGAPTSATNDFSGGTVDALVDRLLIGRGRSGNTVNIGLGVLTFDGGVIDANLVRVGTMVDENTSTNASGVGELNVNGAASLVVNTVLELAHTNTTGVPAAAATAGMRGALNINGGTVTANAIVAAGGTGIITMNNAVLDLAGTAGTPGAPVTVLNTTNSIIHLNLGAPGSFTNIVATTLNAGGFNLIIIDSTLNVTGTQRFPIISYATLNGSAANFTLSDLPDGIAGGMVQNLATKTFDLVLTPATNAVPSMDTVSVSGSHLIVSGTHGGPYTRFLLLGSTDLSLPLEQWSVLATNVFDGTGNFNFTNILDAGAPQEFYQLQVP